MSNPICRETVAEAMENERCGLCASVDHFIEEHPDHIPSNPDAVAEFDRRFLEPDHQQEQTP